MAKRLLLVALTLVLLLGTSGWAQAAESAAPAQLYELTDGVLTVRLPANPTTGYHWTYEISDPTFMELVTDEYVQDEAAEGMAGVGGTWAASFRVTTKEGEGGRVTISFRYMGPSDAEDALPAEGYLLEVWIYESGEMQVDGLWTLVEPVEGTAE